MPMGKLRKEPCILPSEIIAGISELAKQEQRRRDQLLQEAVAAGPQGKTRETILKVHPPPYLGATAAETDLLETKSARQATAPVPGVNKLATSLYPSHWYGDHMDPLVSRHSTGSESDSD